VKGRPVKNQLYEQGLGQLYEQIYAELHDELYTKLHFKLYAELYQKLHAELFDKLSRRFDRLLSEYLFNSEQQLTSSCEAMPECFTREAEMCLDRKLPSQHCKQEKGALIGEEESSLYPGEQLRASVKEERQWAEGDEPDLMVNRQQQQQEKQFLCAAGPSATELGDHLGSLPKDHQIEQPLISVHVNQLEQPVVQNDHFEQLTVLAKNIQQELPLVENGQLELPLIQNGQLDQSLVQNGQLDQSLVQNGQLDQSLVQNGQLDQSLVQNGQLYQPLIPVQNGQLDQPVIQFDQVPVEQLPVQNQHCEQLLKQFEQLEQLEPCHLQQQGPVKQQSSLNYYWKHQEKKLDEADVRLFEAPNSIDPPRCAAETSEICGEPGFEITAGFIAMYTGAGTGVEKSIEAAQTYEASNGTTESNEIPVSITIEPSSRAEPIELSNIASNVIGATCEAAEYSEVSICAAVPMELSSCMLGKSVIETDNFSSKEVEQALDQPLPLPSSTVSIGPAVAAEGVAMQLATLLPIADISWAAATGKKSINHVPLIVQAVLRLQGDVSDLGTGTIYQTLFTLNIHGEESQI
jgi:hypothetical protein